MHGPMAPTLRDENEMLRERIAVLEKLLCDPDLAGLAKEKLQISPIEARILACLLQRRVASRDALLAAISDRQRVEGSDCINVHISRLRAVLRRWGWGISTIYMVGWHLLEDDRASINQFLRGEPQ